MSARAHMRASSVAVDSSATQVIFFLNLKFSFSRKVVFEINDESVKVYQAMNNYG